jgi:hypothetical protein
MNEAIKITMDRRGDPQLRKLARALLSLAQRQATKRVAASRSTPASSGDAQ